MHPNPYNELLTLTFLAEVGRVADTTPNYKSGLELPIEYGIIAALSASPELVAALGFQPADRWAHGLNLYADVMGVSAMNPTCAEVKIWSAENLNAGGYQLTVIEENAAAGADLVLITRAARAPKLLAKLGAGTRWRIVTIGEIAAAAEQLLLSDRLRDVVSATAPRMHEALREQALHSAGLA